MTTTTTPQPDVPPPPGFNFPDLWEPGRILDHNEPRAWRLIYGNDRTITDSEACVTLRAIQFSDGSLGQLELQVLGRPRRLPQQRPRARAGGRDTRGRRRDGRVAWEMTTTNDNPFPNVAPPPGTEPDIWEGDPPQRVVHGYTYGVDGTDHIVWTAAVQPADATLYQPEIHVDIDRENEALTSKHARGLAEQLLDAAREVDGWTQ